MAVASTHHHKNETITKKNRNTIIYTVDARGEEEILDWVLSFGKHAELLEPKDLRAELKDRLQSALKVYSK